MVFNQRWTQDVFFFFFQSCSFGVGPTLEGSLSRFIYHSHIREGNQCLRYDSGNEIWRSVWSEEIIRQEKNCTAESSVQKYKNNVDRVNSSNVTVCPWLREAAVLMLSTFLDEMQNLEKQLGCSAPKM